MRNISGSDHTWNELEGYHWEEGKVINKAQRQPEVQNTKYEYKTQFREWS